MRHVESERLASLDHEPLTELESAHLSECAECRAERDAYAMLARLALEERGEGASGVARAAHAEGAEGVMSTGVESGVALSDWESLSQRLREEGLVLDAGSSVRRSFAGRMWGSGVWRAAAALLLVAGGVYAGRLSVPGAGAVAGGELRDMASAGGSVAGGYVSGVLNGGVEFSSVEEATRVLATAQREYERASLWLASNDTTIRSPEVFRARLAALDQMMAASRAALREAPQDPLLNHYYLSAYTAREATLQQLVSILPVDKTIEGF